MKRLRPNLSSITSRLILFGLTLLLMGAVGRTLLLSYYLRNDLIDANAVQLKTLATYAAQDIEHELRARRALLLALAEQLPVGLLDHPSELQSWLSKRYAINPIFAQGVVVLSKTGKSLASTSGSPLALSRSWSDTGFVRASVPGAVSIGTPFTDPLIQNPLLPMTTPLFDTSGRAQAYLVGLSTLDKTGFLQILGKTHIGQAGGLILVAPADKVFLGASFSGFSGKPLPTPSTQPFIDEATKGFRGTSIGTNAAGIEQLKTAVSVPGSDWFLIAQLPTAEVYQPLTQLRSFILHNTGLLTLVFFAIIIVGLRYLLGPLRNAAQYADKMTQGEIPLAPLPTTRDDEVGHLTEAFNRVLNKLLESQAELRHMAHRDPLTGLPNRHLLADRMNQALSRAQRNNTLVAVLFLDLDSFKPINDTFGHEAGDIALKQVAARLTKTLRRVDTLARVGGDEFVVLLSDLGEDVRFVADAVAKKCLEVFDQDFDINGDACRLGTSIGIAISRGNHAPDKLLTHADKAMYQSKLSGKGQVSWSESA